MFKFKEVVLSSKCQITIPKAIRDILEVKNGDSLVFYIEDNEVKLTSLANLNIKIRDKNKNVTVSKGK